MFLPEPILHKLDKLLGTTRQPYRIHAGGSVDTGCLVWHVPQSNLTPEQMGMLNNALQTASALARRDFPMLRTEEDLDASIESFRMHFLKESSSLDPAMLEAARPILKNPFNPDWGNLRHKGLLTRARKILAGHPVIAYKGNLTWAGVTETLFSSIVVAPTTDPFDILRIEQTYTNNRELSTEEVIARLKTLDESYGIDLTGASNRAVEFKLKRRPKGNAARELGQWLFELAPDIYEAPSSFPKGLVALWWD